ncbi:crAss001_48 related protein [Arsukibacterium indicum]|uniref:Uncharacterized protein n=1 Tax=Arsukibacterium indicum TaxID=2848612 RepID=A0ABS6MH78_9GAMM|nr:hypothetical protein [Arsukibacterium indicum]MBV2128173.1 hypothetical protein [Arsukibacterium indicum]
MSTYIGTKLINAVAMTRLAYNELRGWKLPEDENGDDAGYLVEYLDGGKPNTEHYAGYVSWSPAEQFEKAYIPIGDVSEQPAHMVRVAGERAELADRLNKLNNFIGGDAFTSLSFDQQSLLRKQSDAMQTYLAILNSRLGANQ